MNDMVGLLPNRSACLAHAESVTRHLGGESVTRREQEERPSNEFDG